MNYLTGMITRGSLVIAATALAITAGAGTASASSTDAAPKPVSHARFDSVEQWMIKSHVDLVFHHSGHFLRKWTDADGTSFRAKSYPAVDGGKVRVVYIDNVSTGSDGRVTNYGWAAWSKTWCTPERVCTTVGPV